MNFMVYYITVLFFSGTFAYQWLQFDRNFDCTFGIAVDNKPVSIGVPLTWKTVITSANPLNHIDPKRIRVHTISTEYNNSVSRRVQIVIGNQSFRRKFWVTIGYNDTSHTTIHDIALVELTKNDMLSSFWKPFLKDLPYSYKNKEFDSDHRGWTFAGFGYIDEDHIRDNSILEVSYYDAVLVDCDEWIPREWGRFICLFDDDGLAGLASGAPLFRSNDLTTICGIGAFVLKKGQDNVLVFTDLRAYTHKLYGINYETTV